MLVHGYTEEKLIEWVDLPIETIVEKQIDPWRIDLFEPEPAVHQVGTRTLFFSKMRDAAFAYAEDDARMIVCIQEGCTPLCLSSEQYVAEYSSVQLQNFRVSARPLSHHLARYLAGVGRSNSERQGLQLTKVYSAARANCAVLKGHLLTLCGIACDFGPDFNRNRSCELKHPIQFHGDMFGEVSFPVNLPGEISWVFETLGRFQPVIVYQAIWNALKGKPIDEVEIVFNGAELKEAIEVLRNHPNVTFTGTTSSSNMDSQGTVYTDTTWKRYEHRGCKYLLTSKFHGTTVPAYLDRTDKSTVSVHGVYCSKINEVRGTRMAFYDLARDVVTPISLQAQIWAAALQTAQSTPLQAYFPWSGGSPSSGSPGDGAHHVFTVAIPLQRRIVPVASSEQKSTEVSRRARSAWYQKWYQRIGSRALAA